LKCYLCLKDQKYEFLTMLAVIGAADLWDGAAARDQEEVSQALALGIRRCNVECHKLQLDLWIKTTLDYAVYENSKLFILFFMYLANIVVGPVDHKVANSRSGRGVDEIGAVLGCRAAAFIFNWKKNELKRMLLRYLFDELTHSSSRRQIRRRRFRQLRHRAPNSRNCKYNLIC
jgi:hypothetical protein